MIEDAHGAQEKALNINLDAVRIGTFAEIGAGQEVARWFFHVGKASATVAKSISAYDMAVSDGIYGAADHYVSRARLQAMLDHEYGQLTAQLNPDRCQKNSFFVFADTVATHGSARSSGGHGWLGIRFQDRPGAEPSEVIIHMEMQDAFAASQQEAVGLVGVNLIYGAFTWHHDPAALIRSLMDGLDRRRVEIDMIKFTGPIFAGVDNRLMSLLLVEMGHTDAAMFTAGGEVVQPAELLHNRRVLIERGSFRPITNVTLNLLDDALEQLKQNAGAQPDEPVLLMEMTLNNLMTGRSIDHQDFLARAEILGSLDKTVMISSYTRFDGVTSYLRQYTRNWIAMVAGLPTLAAIFDEQYYSDLPGGILEGLGKLFQGQMKLFAYPTLSSESGAVATAATLTVAPKLQHLYAYLLDNGLVEPIRRFSTDQLQVSPGEVLKMIQDGNDAWTSFVPAPAAALIRRDKLFGLAGGQAPA